MPRRRRGLRTCAPKDCGGDAIGESSRTILWSAIGPSSTSCRRGNCRRTCSHRLRASLTDESSTTVRLSRNETDGAEEESRLEIFAGRGAERHFQTADGRNRIRPRSVGWLKLRSEEQSPRRELAAL